jgi:hypothetical protein
MRPLCAGIANARADSVAVCAEPTAPKGPAAEPRMPACGVLPSRFAGRDSDALMRVGVLFVLSPILGVVHRKKKEAKKKEDRPMNALFASLTTGHFKKTDYRTFLFSCNIPAASHII